MIFHSFLQLSIFHLSATKLFFPSVFFYPHLGQNVLVFFHSGNVGIRQETWVFHKHKAFGTLLLFSLPSRCRRPWQCNFFPHLFLSIGRRTKLSPFLLSTFEDYPLLDRSNLPLRDQQV